MHPSGVSPAFNLKPPTSDSLQVTFSGFLPITVGSKSFFIRCSEFLIGDYSQSTRFACLGDFIALDCIGHNGETFMDVSVSAYALAGQKVGVQSHVPLCRPYHPPYYRALYPQRAYAVQRQTRAIRGKMKRANSINLAQRPCQCQLHHYLLPTKIYSKAKSKTQS